MIISLGLLGLALRTLPLGTAYAIWTGMGQSARPCWAWLCSTNSTDIIRLGCIGLIVAGIVGLKLVTH